MEQVLEAFYYTIELWAFCGILATALAVEELTAWLKGRIIKT